MSGRLLKHVTWLVDFETDPEIDDEESFYLDIELETKPQNLSCALIIAVSFFS